MRNYLQDSKAQHCIYHVCQCTRHTKLLHKLTAILKNCERKYILLYKEFITQLHINVSGIRILAKGYLPISLITPLTLKEILNAVRITVRKTNPDYDLVIKRFYLYYDMKLVTFSIGRDRNLIKQFPVFIQSCTQQLLKLYQIETMLVPIIDQNMQAYSYTHIYR